ncbi:S8 family serine peptidase [Ancylobacter sp. Lp-2]|uniref:S8 family serine peptidase n=1 Tax=Ancylobacter sp. Lp-2 TaxID=2881339 RepID=UPI0021067A93|nr:S8 family serine peptidase [Ancylobacter sp. Lp-2]
MDRVFVRLPTKQLKLDLLQGVALDLKGHVPRTSVSNPDTLVMQVGDEERCRLESLGATIFENVTFTVLPDADDDHGDFDRPQESRLQAWQGLLGDAADGDLGQVMQQIRAPQAWRHSRGRGVTIAVVDTGISDGLLEIGRRRRSPVNLALAHRATPWEDTMGHGSMCAAIAAGSSLTGRYDGVAPEATVIAARCNLCSDDVLAVYDNLIEARDAGLIEGPVVATNSYGVRICQSPGYMPGDHPFMRAIEAAVARGIFVCFAAGNYHAGALCQFQPDDCGPNSIWGRIRTIWS